MNLTDLFRALGLNTPRWQWRAMRWEKAIRQLSRGKLPGNGGLKVARTLIAVNLILFSLMALHGIFAGVGFSSLFSPPTQLLLVWGGQFWTTVIEHGQWWRCLTYAFTHGGIIHLAFNMLVLFQVGPLVESEIGSLRFLVLYTLAALTGSLADYIWHPFVPVVGASSAIFGLIGFAVVYYHRLGDPASLERRNFMFQWAAFAFIFGLVVGADNAGHLGGILGGAAFGFVLPTRGLYRSGSNRLFQILGGGCLLAMALSLLSMLWWIVTS